MNGKMQCAVCCKLVFGNRKLGGKVCQACKIFYRRAASKKSNYVCLLGGKCSTLGIRNGGIKCKPCRFRKCREFGVSLREHGDSDVDVPINVKVFVQAAETITAVVTDRRISPDENNEYSFPESVDSDGNTLDCNVDKFSSNRSFTSYERNLSHEKTVSDSVASLNSIIDHIFGKQLRLWTAKMSEARTRKNVSVSQNIDIGIDEIACAINETTGQFISEMVRFLNYLPGMAEVEGAGIRSITAGWKWVACTMIHHAEFMTEDESFYTVGASEYQFSRYWHERLADQPLVRFIFQFCTEFRKIKLTQTERYLLLVVILLEPDSGMFLENLSDSINCWKPCPRLSFLHRHYTAALLRAIQQRCSSDSAFTVVLHQLGKFFSLFEKAAAWHHRSYRFQCPRFSVEAKSRVRRLQINCEISGTLVA